MTGGDRGRRALVAFDGERVLLLARDAAPGGDVFRGDAHVDGVERIGQRSDHRVEHLGVAHARAPALGRVHVRGAAHALGAAGDGGVGVAEEDVLRGADDRLQTAAAQAIERQGAGRMRQAAVDAGHARQVHVLGLAVQHAAEHALADVGRVDLRPAHRLLDHARRQLRRRDVLEASAVITDGGAHAAQDDDFPLLAHE